MFTTAGNWELIRLIETESPESGSQDDTSIFLKIRVRRSQTNTRVLYLSYNTFNTIDARILILESGVNKSEYDSIRIKTVPRQEFIPPRTIQSERKWKKVGQVFSRITRMKTGENKDKTSYQLVMTGPNVELVFNRGVENCDPKDHY